MFLGGTHNAWVHLVLLTLAMVLAWHYRLTSGEWLAIILASGLVLSAEAFNTAIELVVDLVSPDFHPLAKNAKDVAAAAVLIAAATAAIVGVVIFLPRILATP